MAAKICIVDDDIDFSESLALTMEGKYEIDLAHSGEEAIKKFQKENYDFALIDFKLPGKNGIETFLEIRKFKPTAKCIIMTGYCANYPIRTNERGILQILQKPLDIYKLFGLIKQGIAKSILIVDDDPDVLESTKEIFEKNEQIYLACNGQEALECIENNDIDLLILDLKMPTLDGIATCRKLIQSNHQISVIIVSAYEEEIDKIKSLKSSFICDIMSKPIDPNKLLATIDEIKQENL